MINDNDRNNNEILKEFYNSLNNKILNVTKNKQEQIILENISFPTLSTEQIKNEFLNYLNLLTSFKDITFKNCIFNTSNLDLPNTRVSFQNCQYLQPWIISKIQQLNDASCILFKNCKFQDDIIFNFDNMNNIDFFIFNNCDFNKKLCFKNIQFNQSIFKNTNENEKISLQQLSINNCQFSEKFILNNLIAINLSIQNSEFAKKFELKNTYIKHVEFVNTNFHHTFDCYNSNYSTFFCSKCIFDNFAGFESCEFSKGIKSQESNSIPCFEYVTFLSFVNFRNSSFYNGLNLDLINLSGDANFLNIYVDFTNTTHETYRIIKYSFDKVGDHVEANKFFTNEMKKYKAQLFNDPKADKQERIIFWLNEKMSNFGQSYLRPLIWMFVFSSFYGMILYGYKENWIASNFPTLSLYLNNFLIPLNFIAKNVMPFKGFEELKQGMEFISLIFTAIFASLTWQFIVAVKRHTRR